MITKLLTAVVLTGALYVAGDAAFQKFGCSFQCPFSSESTGGCCVLVPAQKTDDSAPKPDCCAPKSKCCATSESCCDTDK